MQFFLQGAGSSQNTRKVLFMKARIWKKLHCVLNDTDDTVEVSLVKEEQKKLPENIMFV